MLQRVLCVLQCTVCYTIVFYAHYGGSLSLGTAPAGPAVLQRVAMCCRAISLGLTQQTLMCYVVQCVSVWCSKFQCVAVYRAMHFASAPHSRPLCLAACCSVLQRVCLYRAMHVPLAPANILTHTHTYSHTHAPSTGQVK